MSMQKTIYDAKLDQEYQDPYVDVDEWRERFLPDGTKVPFRYIHGGFTKKGVKFIFCFPEKENYRGHFFQYLSPFPGPDEETASLDKSGEDDKIAFAVTNGAYFVESNMGSSQVFGSRGDNTIVYKSSAAVAEYSRVKAMEIYGCGRPYGYVYGGSGGGYKTMACIENTNAWDGAVPYVIGSPVSLPNTITLHAQGQRALRRVFGKIVDAVDAGGSGDLYEGLTEDEAAMLREITAFGFSPGIWFMEAAGVINDGSLPVLAPGIKMADSQYFKDFWEIPGYLGTDERSSAQSDRLQFHGVVKAVHIPEPDTGGAEAKSSNTAAKSGSTVDAENAMCAAGAETGKKVCTAEKDGMRGDGVQTDGRNGVDDAWKKMLADGHNAWIELEEVPTGDNLYLQGVNICFETGDAAGKQLLLGGIEGRRLMIGMCYGMDDLPGVLSKVRPGDRVFLDNSDYIAIQSYYRHQVPEDLSFHAWDQFRDESGKPVLPQRNNVMGYHMTGTGTVQDGNIQGRVIVVQALMDESTCPWCADWYRSKVVEAKGNEQDFRLYYMERCMHGDEFLRENNMVTNYMGALRQVLLDLSDWVEKGKEPLGTTDYQYREGQIIPAERIVERKGIQPKVTLLAEGSSCAHVKAGETVHFTAKVEVPEGAGVVTAIDYDFEDKWILPAENIFPVKGIFERTTEGSIHGAISSITHAFDRPGTYFVSMRAKANRNGNGTDIFTQVKNIARVRVVVEQGE